MTSDDIEQRGKELRAALQRAYQKLVDAHQLRGGIHGTDVTEVVLPYIPIGTSFRKAEAVLRDAGFAIGPHPDSNPPTNPIYRTRDWCAVVASISPFVQRLFERVELYVALIPKSLGDYTDISRLEAKLYVSSP